MPSVGEGMEELELPPSLLNSLSLSEQECVIQVLISSPGLLGYFSMYFSLLNFTFFRKHVGGALNYHYDPAFPSLLPPLKNWGTPGMSSFWLKTATATPFCVSFGEPSPGHPHLRTSCQEAPKYFSLKTRSCSFSHLTNSVVNLSIFDQGQKI